MPFELNIGLGGWFTLFTLGPFVFFLMRMAHKLALDPDYEDKVFKRTVWNKK